MQLVMTILVRDEQDILRENLDFHLAMGVDFFIATDNRSVDATPQILREFESRGVLRHLYEGDDDYNQRGWVTRMARMASVDHGADWVINNDADEFWWPPGGDLKEVFARVPTDASAVQVQRTNFVISGDPAGPFWSRMTHRQRVSLNSRGTPLPPKVAHRGSPGVQVEQGSHEVRGLAGEVVPLNDLEILHFPVRSEAQILNKIGKGGAAYARNTELDELTGRTWRELHRTLLATGHLDDYYRAHCFDAKRLAAAVEAGELLEDRRLYDFFNGRGAT